MRVEENADVVITDATCGDCGGEIVHDFQGWYCVKGPVVVNARFPTDDDKTWRHATNQTVESEEIWRWAVRRARRS